MGTLTTRPSISRMVEADLGGITAWGQVTAFTAAPEMAVPGEMSAAAMKTWRVAATGIVVLMLTYR